MGLSTKNIATTSGGALNKKLGPGQHKVQIEKIYCENPTYATERETTFIKLVVVSEAPEGFEGMNRVWNDPSQGTYSGPFAIVKNGQYAFSDSPTIATITRIDSMLKFMKNLCVALDCVQWLEDQDGIESIEALVEKANTDKIFEGKWLYVTLGGKKRMNDKGYPVYDLWLAKNTKEGYSMVSEAKMASLLPFTDDMVKDATEPVAAFSPSVEDDDDVLNMG